MSATFIHSPELRGIWPGGSSTVSMAIHMYGFYGWSVAEDQNFIFQGRLGRKELESNFYDTPNEEIFHYCYYLLGVNWSGGEKILEMAVLTEIGFCDSIE